MLLRLQIENIALIERAELELGPGLNVLTGETGAGKTMLAQAIGLVAGGAPAPGLVGPHAEESYVEAEFAVPEGFWEDEALEPVAGLRPEGEDTLVVARRLTASGRSRALVWGRSCARADLEAIGERLLEVSSQHEARKLARPAYQLGLLDAAGGLEELTAGMAAAWAGLRAARSELDAARHNARELARRRGELEELAARMEEAAPEPGERERLGNERERLRHLDDLAAALDAAAALVNPEEGEGALSLTGRAAERVGEVERFDVTLAPLAADLRDAAVRLQETAIEIRARLDGLDADPGRLEELEDRLQLFSELERRFGAPVEELAEQALEARQALDLLDEDGERMALLEQAVGAALAGAQSEAAALSAARRDAAEPFARAVESELDDLGMAAARLEVDLEEAELGPRGTDSATLRLAANPGLPAQPLAQVASGGELSRIALAVRVAARSAGGPGTLLLDEVDAGVGGRTARAVGEKLRRLSDAAQLLCITHLPQIAGLAETHFRVEKSPGEPTVTGVVRLRDAEVVDELARMLGADEGDSSARKTAAGLRG
jgi:DNA repair protein RecN (Recombination protein N)